MNVNHDGLHIDKCEAPFLEVKGKVSKYIHFIISAKNVKEVIDFFSNRLAV
jgi:hypothetical protein